MEAKIVAFTEIEQKGDMARQEGEGRWKGEDNLIVNT